MSDFLIRLKIDDNGTISVIGSAKSKLKDFKNEGKKAGESVTKSFKSMYLGITAVVAGLTGVALGINNAVNKASDFREENSKLLTVFNSMQSGALDAVDELSDKYNMSELSATRLLGATGDLLTGIGIQQKKSLELSATTQKLAADIASFTNIEGGAARASAALTKLMLGERESAKELGIAINETDVKIRLAAEGKDKLTGLARRQAVAEISLKMAMEQSKNAIGDVARTSDSYANIKRRVAARTEDLIILLGDKLIPVFKTVLIWFGSAIDKITKLVELFGGLNKNLSDSSVSMDEFTAAVQRFDTQQITKEIKNLETELKELRDKAVVFGDDYAALSGDLEEVTPAMLKQIELQRQFAEQTGSSSKAIDPLGDKIKLLEAKISSLKEQLVLKNDAISTGITEIEAKSITSDERIIASTKNVEDVKLISEETIDGYKQQVQEMAMQREIENAEETIRITEESVGSIMDILGQYSEWAQAERDQEAADKKDKLAKDVKNKKKAAKDDLELGKITQAEYDKRIAAIESYEERQSATIEKEQKKRSGIEKAYAIGRTIITTYEMATKAFNSLAQIPIVGTVLGAIAAAAAIVFGMKQVANIKSTGFKDGGEFKKGESGFIEGHSTEIIAPKKTFIDVVNDMINTNEIGGAGNSGAISQVAGIISDAFSALGAKVDNIAAKVAGLELAVDLDAQELAWTVKQGETLNNKIKF